jgi:UDP-2,3-diacylglucosamine hydrolase
MKIYADYLGEDKEYLVKFSKHYLQHDPSIDYFIFGHRHILLDLLLNKKSRVLIIGDWMQHFSYAVLDENGLLSLETESAAL